MTKNSLFAIIIAVFVLIIGNLPLVYFHYSKKDNLIFLDRQNINSQDVYTYVSFIEQAKNGHLVFQNLYTSEPQKPSLIRPSYLLIGKIAALTHVSSISAYHFARIILSILFFFLLYHFLKLFFEKDAHRLASFALIASSSGLGYLFGKWLPTSADLWIPESTTFMSLLEAPHFTLSLILTIITLHYFLKYLSHQKSTYLIAIVSSLLLLSFEHPFNLVVIIPVIFLTSLWSGLPLVRSLVLSGLSSIGLLYQGYITLTDPVLKAWQSQNALPSPAPIAYIVGYGLLLPLVILGINKYYDQPSRTYKLLIAWVIITLILLYAPFSFQRRFVESIHIALGILATYGIFSLQKQVGKKQPSSLPSWLIITALSFSSLFVVYQNFQMINQDVDKSYYYHIAEPEIVALNWLKANTTEEDVVLSNWYIGNLVPGMIGRKVYLGHKVQTTNFNSKSKELDSFLVESNDDISRDFLRTNHITHLFFGVNDQLLQNTFKPGNKSFLKHIYSEKDTSIYQVI